MKKKKEAKEQYIINTEYHLFECDTWFIYRFAYISKQLLLKFHLSQCITYIHTCIACVCVCIYTHTHTRVYIYVYVYIYIYVYICVHMCTHMYTYTYMCVCTHTHTHARIYIYRHTHHGSQTDNNSKRNIKQLCLLHSSRWWLHILPVERNSAFFDKHFNKYSALYDHQFFISPQNLPYSFD